MPKAEGQSSFPPRDPLVNMKRNKESGEEEVGRSQQTPAARPATLAFALVPAAAQLPPWSVGPCISPWFLLSPHCRGVV